MVGHYRLRDSKAARWCQSLGLLALVYFGLVVLLAQLSVTAVPQTLWLIAFGLLLVIVGLALCARAFHEVWTLGRAGTGPAMRGLLLLLALLSPFLWSAWRAIELPTLNDVATTPAEPVPFPTLGQLRDPVGGMNPVAEPDEARAEMQLAAYPQIAPRRYAASPEAVFAAVQRLVQERGWQVVSTRVPEEREPALVEMPEAAQVPVPQPAPRGGASLPAEPAPDALAGAEVPAEDDGGRADAMTVEASLRSPVFAFVNDVVVEVSPEEDATRVEMRASSRYGAHDFGVNAALVAGFLDDLDKALGGLGGQG